MQQKGADVPVAVEQCNVLQAVKENNDVIIAFPKKALDAGWSPWILSMGLVGGWAPHADKV